MDGIFILYFSLRGGFCLCSSHWDWCSGSPWRLTTLRRRRRGWLSLLALPSSQVSWWGCESKENVLFHMFRAMSSQSVIIEHLLFALLPRRRPRPHTGLCHCCQSQVRKRLTGVYLLSHHLICQWWNLIYWKLFVSISIIVTAFLGTSMIFACFTLSALYAKRRSYLFLGGKGAH